MEDKIVVYQWEKAIIGYLAIIEELFPDGDLREVEVFI